MEHKQSSGSVCDQLLSLSTKYPWFVAGHNQGTDDETDQYFYAIHEPLTKYPCQIPELLGKLVRGCYHGWVILSDHLQKMWSLWNPVTSKMIHFPPLILNDGSAQSFCDCCLSAPPEDPTSLLLLTRTNKPTLVFFRLEGKRKKLRWIEMSYASQLKRITGVDDDCLLHNLTCCNRKIYALNYTYLAHFIMQLDVLVKEKEVVIKFMILGACPSPSFGVCGEVTFFLKGYGTELFCIYVDLSQKRLAAVYLYKLDMASIKTEDLERFKSVEMRFKRYDHDKENMDDILESMTQDDMENLEKIATSVKMWEQVFDLKDAIFFVDLGRNNLTYYRPGIASEMGGYIHIRDTIDNILYSYNVKENTVFVSSMPSLLLSSSNVSLWEFRLEDDHGGAERALDSKQEENQIAVRSVTHDQVGLNEWNLTNLPFDILEMIMEHCVAVEYLNFRATCKRCEVAAPLVHWSNQNLIRRLQTHSLVSPWLMVVDANQDIITFTDPMLGDNYFMKNLHVSLNSPRFYCSRFGWLLFYSSDFECLVFFNPFTNDLRKLPETEGYWVSTVCFSAPPTSPDCMVVGFARSVEFIVLIHFVARESSWRTIRVGDEPCSISFLTFSGEDLYALGTDGELIGFKALGEEVDSSAIVEARSPISCCTSPAKYYLMTCDKDLLMVIVGKLGEGVEVFKSDVSKQEWEKIDSLGNHMIYICDTTCLCIEAKTREMENKIYFPLSKNKKIVWYSLETCTYHTFSGGNIEQHFKELFGTTYHLFPHVWIEPTWS